MALDYKATSSSFLYSGGAATSKTSVPPSSASSLAGRTAKHTVGNQDQDIYHAQNDTGAASQIVADAQSRDTFVECRPTHWGPPRTKAMALPSHRPNIMRLCDNLSMNGMNGTFWRRWWWW